MCKKERLANSAKKEVDFSKQQFNLVAIIEKGGRILSIGTNNMTKSRTAYFNGDFDKGTHAEFNAISLIKNAKDADIHIFRFKRDGSYGDSKPCQHCMREIKKSGIKRIFYWEDSKQKVEKITNEKRIRA